MIPQKITLEAYHPMALIFPDARLELIASHAALKVHCTP